MISQTDLFTAPTGGATRTVMNGKPVFTVPSKTVLNLESGFRHKLLCDGPTFSTGTACVYSCAFCYVPDMARKLRDWHIDHGVTGRHEDIVIRRANAVDILRQQLAAPKARALADKPLVIYSSPAVDVAGNLELVRETIACCKVILEQTQWHIRLLSKSNLLPKIAEALPADRMIYGVSTGTLDDRLAQAFEAGTPLVSKRLQSLHWLQDHGYRTYGMICPSLPQRDYAQFARDQAAAIRADRCEHVWAEVINLRGESFSRTIAALSAGGHQFEVNELLKVSRDKAAWEAYARATFEAHARIYSGGALASGAATVPASLTKLRFLQYPAAGTRTWWEQQIPRGAILL